MPILKLRRHQSTFSDEDILINSSDYPGLKLNDIVELKLLKGGNNSNRILLQVRRWPETNQRYPNSVSIKDSVINTHLQLYADVVVNIIDKKDVLVDSIEICFSNAYLARSYMWGLRTHLNNRCVYQRQKLDYLHIRSQICEIWAQGNKVTSGYVDDDTKIVFRSASSLVYLFIQMSSEMWDYDINGDLYSEKAINGFLKDLFDTWRQNDCSHDITIVLFSRTYYDAESIDEFPKEMRECLQIDYKGRFYEDCYRVAFQNDRFDLHDWNVKLTTLKSLFNQYQKEVINRHQEKYNTRIPRAYNSSAAQGNFLEVLNMSLNVFEKHYFDRSFDRTGQLSVVVSPGVGVFEVDFDMTNLTKQRIIDNGIGSDLVCLGEQPLHTVPLLKFNSKATHTEDNLATCDVYNMPHWINLSFYSSQNQVYYSNFIPRIKLPTLNTTKQHLKHETSKNAISECSNMPTSANTIRTDQQDATLIPSETLNDNQSSEVDRSFGKDNLRGLARHHRRIGELRDQTHSSNHTSHHTSAIPDLVDYDEFDAQVFKINPSSQQHQRQQHPSSRGTSTGADRSILSDMDPSVDYISDDNEYDDFMLRGNRLRSIQVQRRSPDAENQPEHNRHIRRQTSENLPILQHSPVKSSSRAGGANGVGVGLNDMMFNGNNINNSSQGITLNNQSRMSLKDSYLSEVKMKPESADDLSVRGYNVQSSRLNRVNARPKALINPFDPSHMTIKLTPNRRRWTHVFPQGPTGGFIQQHHYQQQQTLDAGGSAQKGNSLPYLADVSPTLANMSNTNDMLMVKKTSSGSMTNHQQKLQRTRLTRPNSRNDSVSMISRLSSQDYRQMPTSSTVAINRKVGSSSGAGLLKPQMASPTKSTLVSNETVRFAWCASGEQEWTPAITTGVDWKSLTMPACLPLTTDFFPSKTSLQNDYVIGEYNIDSSCIHSRYTLIEVYRELVCQRLQKGFQIILLPGQTAISTKSRSSYAGGSHSSGQGNNTINITNNINSNNMQSTDHHRPSTSSNIYRNNHHSSSHLTGGGSSNSSSNRNRSIAVTSNSRSNALAAVAGLSLNSSYNDCIVVEERERTEYTMSIGRIFHKLTLNGNTITVTQYRPRHPYPTIKIDYCYRFRAPFHETYGQSWVHFKSEKLENYSWNYLDNYICARGESYELRSSLKFWRFRILILPSKLNLSKIIHNQQQRQSMSASADNQSSGKENPSNGLDTPNAFSSGNRLPLHVSKASSETIQTANNCNINSSRHDIFHLNYNDEDHESLMDSFVKLLEIINKTRRASACRLPSSSKVLSTGGPTLGSVGLPTPTSLASVGGPTATTTGTTSTSIQTGSSSSSAASMCQTGLSKTATIDSHGSSNINTTSSNNNNNNNSSSSDVCEAGVTSLSVASNNVGGASSTFVYPTQERQHLSSPTRLIVQIGPSAASNSNARGCSVTASNELVASSASANNKSPPITETSVASASTTNTTTTVGTVGNNTSHTKGGNGGRNNIEVGFQSTSAEASPELEWESINMDIDSALRDAKRSEWVHVQYHNYYDIYQAYELVIKWMVASGAGIAEMVQGWARKAGNSSVHVVPIPWEPFAMPDSGKADPLRCPLVIELHLDCLPTTATNSIAGTTKQTRYGGQMGTDSLGGISGGRLSDNQIISLQDKILRRFGFLRFHDLISTDENIERQYVHLSGFAFVALPNLMGAADEADDTNAEASQLAQAASQQPMSQQDLTNDQLITMKTRKKSSRVVLASAQESDDALQQTSKSKAIDVGGDGSAGTEPTSVAGNRASSEVGQAQGNKQRASPNSKENDEPKLSKTVVTSTKPIVQQPKLAAQNLKLLHQQDTVSSPHEEYITRHIGGTRQNKSNRLRDENERVEFIWSWNYMLTKRWRSPSTLDESYAVNLMQDFKQFCANSDNRLLDFWHELQQQS